MMKHDIDRLIAAATPGDHVRLAGVEDAVWARVGAHRDRTRIGQVRLAVVAISCAIGITNGGLLLLSPRPEPSEMRIFTMSSGLSPLASLDVRG